MFCGTGTDKALVDLKDGPAGFSDCEAVSQAAVDQHPTVVIQGPSLRLHQDRHGRWFVNVKLTCPRALHAGCQGSLTIEKLHGSRRTVGRRDYAKISAGSSARVKVTIAAGAVHGARRAGHIDVRVDALELDANGMPKHTLRTMPLRG